MDGKGGVINLGSRLIEDVIFTGVAWTTRFEVSCIRLT